MPTTLSAGDIAFTAFQADNSGGGFNGDAFEFVLLKSVTAGTTIYFTDNAYRTDGTNFRTNENMVRWVAQGDLNAGTKITFTAPGGSGAASTAEWTGINPQTGDALATAAFGLAGGGDNIAAIVNPTFGGSENLNGTAIAQLLFGSTSFPGSVTGTTSTTNNTSGLLPGLTDGVNAVSVGSSIDNGRYNDAAAGSVETGTADAIRTSINTDSFWTTSGSPLSPHNTTATFTISPPAGPVKVYDGTTLLSSHATIQGAVDAAAAGNTIEIDAGTYAEQVVIDGKSNLTLKSAGGTVTISAPDAPTPLTLSATAPNGSEYYGVVTVKNADDVTIDGITIDGNGRGTVAGAGSLAGVLYRNASGSLLNSVVDDVNDGDPALYGMQRGIGVVVINDDPVVGDIPDTGDPLKSFVMTGTTISDFQKNAVLISNAAVTLTGNTLLGNSDIGAINGQNGFQVSDSTGTIANNEITGIGYTGPAEEYYASGILVYENNGLIVTGNTITGSTDDGANFAGIDWTDSLDGEISGNTISNALYGIAAYGYPTDFGGLNVLNGLSIGANTFVNTDTNLLYETPAGSSAPYPLLGTTGNDTLGTSDGADVIDGLAGNDTLNGGAGNDAIYGGYGDDTVDGGDGIDSIFGLSGDDTVHGGNDADGIAGEDGNDTLHGDAGDDYILGGAGEDTIAGGADNDSLFGDAGFDNIDGGDGNDSIDGGVGIDTIHGGAGNDYLSGGADGDEIMGDDGDDFAFGGSGIDVLKGGEGNDGLDGGDDIDYLYGDAGIDWLFGQAGDDSLLGGSDGDVLFGGEGGDSLYGEAGADRLDGGAGNDILEGGTGGDTFSFAPAWGHDRIQDFEDGIDLIDIVDPALTSFSQLTISQVGADTLITFDGNSITLVNIQATNLTTADILTNGQPFA